jgi:AcrR family transcriptional regulator
MRTGDRIVEQSLVQFNSEGLPRVSTNRIAAELETSPGNLYRHFKSKAQTVEWLIRRFEQRAAPLNDPAIAVAALDDWWLTPHLVAKAIIPTAPCTATWISCCRNSCAAAFGYSTTSF